MSVQENKSQGTQPPPATSQTGHPLPRRSSPANSVTLKHHQATRDASLRASAGSIPPGNNTDISSRRNSSGDSHHTSQSDAKKWFDQSNKNPTATFDSHAMDVDPPFFQRETESSNEDKSYNPLNLDAPPKLPTGAQSSSADEYRSVIDDLTVEIQRLKDELRRYKQNGPDTLRKDKLFEIKVHGLPKRKKRELESTLRDFAASLDGSPDGTSSKRDKTSRHTNRNRMYSNSGSMSKHASSSSGSNIRPVDSAYASMSTGANSSGTSLGRPPTSMRAKSSERKVESYLRDIPEGLYPRYVAMTDKERKRIVVRRLEQLFTGKISGRLRQNNNKSSNGLSASGNTSLAPVVSDEQQQRPLVHQPPSLGNQEPIREAKILLTEQQSGAAKKGGSRDNGSASNSNGDQTESGGNGNSSGGTMAANISPTTAAAPEQRPTRLTDLDPDRTQVPSDNMDYIKHLGLVPPGLLAETEDDVNPDADGWVYLNLLCNLAQLHIMNVTPDFVRNSVSEMSTKFQLSPDGRKIRWRGGTEGTKFSSDSSGENSGNNSMEIDTASMDNSKHKRQKTGHSTGTADEFHSGGCSSKHPSKFGPQFSTPSESFHYKPIFAHQDSLNGQTSADETLSSFGPVEESNMDASRWGQSGSGASNRRKRRHDGAIIYYSGAPFCTDLSGDPGDASPTTYLQSSNQDSSGRLTRPFARRSESGSSLPLRPLSDSKKLFSEPVVRMEIDGTENIPGLATDSSDEASEVEMDLEWSNEQQFLDVHTLEPCGLGGVLPEDHFMVIVTTKRPMDEVASSLLSSRKLGAEETAESIIGRLESMSTTSPDHMGAISPQKTERMVEIDYVSGRIKRLAPVRLPPPAIFFPPFSTDTSDDDDEPESLSITEDNDVDSDEGVASRRANLHHSDDYPDGVDLSSGDEDGEEPENEPDTRGMYDSDQRHRPFKSSKLAERKKRGSAEVAAGQGVGRSKSSNAGPSARTGGSSAATAGGLGSDITGADISS